MRFDHPCRRIRIAFVGVMAFIAMAFTACSNSQTVVRRDEVCVKRDTGFFLGINFGTLEDVVDCPTNP